MASPNLTGRDTTPGTPKSKSIPGTPKFMPSSGSTRSPTPTMPQRPTTPGTPRKVPAAIIAAAMAISTVSPQTPNPSIKRLSSRGKVLLAEGATTDVPPVPYPPPLVIPQRISSKAYFPSPPLDPSTSTAAAI
ncbi:hypothetical protein BGX26_008642, partial [Mortierella sp. AD094]